MPKIQFRYSGFWDVPRYIFCSLLGRELLLLSEFDDHLDDYDPNYQVYALPAKFEPGAVWSWEVFPLSEARLLGAVPVAMIEFDPTKRVEFEAEPLLGLLSE